MPKQDEDFKKVLALMLGPGFMNIPEPGANRMWWQQPGSRISPGYQEFLNTGRPDFVPGMGPDLPPGQDILDEVQANIEQRDTRVKGIRTKGNKLKADMQKMIDEAQAGGQSAEARLKTAMDKLNEAKAAGSNAPAGSAAEEAFQDVARARAANAPPSPAAEPPTFNMGRVASRFKGPAIGIGTGIIGGLLMDYMVRYADQQRALARVRGPYGA